MVDMNQTEYNQILKIIQRDIQSNDLDHLKQIRDYLNNNQIPTASQIRYNKATFWENKTIKNILKNQIYCRHYSTK